MSKYDLAPTTGKAIRDDNLRLILAKHHDRWLTGEWRYHRIWLCLASGLLVASVLSIIFIVIAPIWIVLMIKAIYEMRRVRGWQHEHYDFLSKYNREYLSSFTPA